jgi:hypothetical protein
MVLGIYSAYGYLIELWLSKALLKASVRPKGSYYYYYYHHHHYYYYYYYYYRHHLLYAGYLYLYSSEKLCP